VLVRRMTYAMLRRLERERHSVTGPLQKAPDRVRHEIVRGPRLQELIDDLAAEKPGERAKVTERALDMLKELQATPELGAVKGMEVVFHRVFNRIYAGIEYDAKDIERLRAIARDGTLILLPSHKSHSDYLILSYIFNEQNLPLPLIAAGDNLNFFPLGAIFRRAGAFFIRRSFKGDRLYAAVVDAYIRRLIRDGFPIELFLEGGRSRNGKLLPPKFGLLSMIVDAALAVPQRKTFFVPVSIGYERVIEASSYERELSGAEKRKEDAAGLLQTPKILRHKYGRINLQVGQILTLGELAGELGIAADEQLRPAKRRALVTRLGNRVMDEINRVTAVTPGTLTALALLSHRGRGISHTDFIQRCLRLLDTLRASSARISPTILRSDGALHPDAIHEALQMFLHAELVDAYAGNSDGEPTLLESFRGRRRTPGVNQTGYYAVRDGRRLMLDTSKNLIVHFFVERGLVSIAALAAPGLPADVSTVRERVRQLSRLFKFEFRFRADATFEEIFDDTVSTMQQAGHIERQGDRLVEGPGSHDQSGKAWLEDYAAILRNFLEGYRVAARALNLLVRGPMAEKDWVKRALSLGSRMYLAGEIERREAVSKPILENALLAYGDLGYLKSAAEKVELMSAFSSAETVKAVERDLAGFLGEREEQA
jgi:glycerol-3-phosphate O-acyltransferase